MADVSPAPQEQRSFGWLVVLGVLVLLLGLPVAAWLDMRELSERILRRQADEVSRIIDDMRGFYASDVVGRIMANHGAQPTHNYKDVPGGIPIPATLSIELGQRISARNDAVRYRFVSDQPFKGRATHNLDTFEQDALAALRKNPKMPIVAAHGTLFESVIRLATPVIMGATCVSCHNSHPDSPRTDWKVGDVRAIQEITVRQPIGANVFSFKYLLAYFFLVGLAGLSFILLQRRQARVIHAFNRELSEANNFLASISMKIAKYISPQIYKSIFSGERDVAIATERKKLTIFFSDIENFTATAERLQPEDLTALLNEYFTEMSAIALRHGATVDKFVGDAMLLFFGDPETKGVQQDARACVEMAAEMQQRLVELDAQWHRRGIEQPFRA
ncbi:MAG TPA: adenylate/guanylate cyclase domain-containing protein, partial [Xanthobacteraceae bacterium]|nr:adenylate/guanylate cyclase domain-containing protein [Xanthobacteraceae bacterium]